MAITLTAQQKQRRDTASNWTSANPTLLAGELGHETDTGLFKIGDGSTAWSSLAYLPIPNTSRLLAGNLTVGGNFQVNGTTTTIDTTTLTVEDKNIEIGKVTTPSDTTADGGGITLLGSSNKTITWTNSTDSWDFNQHVNLASTYELKINNVSILSATTLGSSVVNSSLTSVGTIASGTWQGTTVAVDQGGTGQTSYTNGQLLIGNTTGNTLAKATLTGGTGCTVTNGAGSISLAVDITDSTSSTSTTTSASPNSVKSAYDLANTANTTANAAIPKSLTDAKGDIVTATADNTPARLAAGTDGYFLKADSSESTGLAWASVPAGVGGATGVDFNDDVQVRFGTDNDLVVKHSGAAAFVTNSLGSFNLNSGGGLDITTGGDITIGAGHPIIIEAITGNAGGHVQFREGTTGGTNTVSIKGPETIASDYSIVLPNAAPTANGQVLTSTTAGIASWADASGGGAKGSSGEEIFWENEKQMDNDYTISGSGAKNAGVFGPLTLAATLTVPSGCTLTIV